MYSSIFNCVNNSYYILPFAVCLRISTTIALIIGMAWIIFAKDLSFRWLICVKASYDMIKCIHREKIFKKNLIPNTILPFYLLIHMPTIMLYFCRWGIQKNTFGWEVKLASQQSYQAFFWRSKLLPVKIQLNDKEVQFNKIRWLKSTKYLVEIDVSLT